MVLIIDYLKRAFLLVFSSSLIATTILSFLRLPKQNETTTKVDVPKEKGTVENLRFGISFFLFSAVIVLIIAGIFFAIKAEQHWIFVFCVALTYLKCTTGAFSAVGVLGGVIKSNSNKELSARDYIAIDSIAYFIFYLGVANIFDPIIDWATQYPSNAISDGMIALGYVVLIFLYLFFILILLPSPLACCIKILQKVIEKVPFKHKIIELGDFFVCCIHEEETPSNLRNPLSYRTIRHIKKATHKVMWVLYLFAPIVFAVDVILLLLIVDVEACMQIIGYVVMLFRQVKMAVAGIAIWILTLSNERVVAISFRLALIIALTTVQVFNRYQPLFKEYDASTSTFEFLASAIVIPVILDWLNSVRKYAAKGVDIDIN